MTKRRPDLTHQDLLDFLKALGSETRQRILLQAFADQREHSVGEVAQRAGIQHSTASGHLSMLGRAGVLQSRRDGKEVLYRVDLDSAIARLDRLREILVCCAPPSSEPATSPTAIAFGQQID